MEIIQIVNENQNLLEGSINLTVNNSTTSYRPNISTEKNQTTHNSSINEKFYHKDYLSLLYFSILAFFILGYYLYYTAKVNLKRIKSTNRESTASIAKYTNIKKLAYANFGIIVLISF